MRMENIEAEALKLDPKARARLAETLLESLEQLTDSDNARLWADEAERRDAEWDAKSGVGRPAADVIRAARASCHELVDLELNEAAKYYELETPGLGVAFVNEGERCQRSIEQHPESGVVVQGAVRRRLLWRFPYALLYSTKPDSIRILAVMNLKRRPAYWAGRRDPTHGPTACSRPPAA